MLALLLLSAFGIFLAFTFWKNKEGYVPIYTYPIDGICEDGEFVTVVLKRLENDPEKLAVFKKRMNIV